MENYTTKIWKNFTEVVETAESLYDQNKTAFWAYAALYLFVGIIAVIGNSLVLVITRANRNSSQLQTLDNAIKSLALADVLFGLMGIPCKLAFDLYAGKSLESFSKFH